MSDDDIHVSLEQAQELRKEAAERVRASIRAGWRRNTRRAA
jgi:hypothetical protein